MQMTLFRLPPPNLGDKIQYKCLLQWCDDDDSVTDKIMISMIRDDNGK